MRFRPLHVSVRGGVAALSAFVSCLGCVPVLWWRAFVLGDVDLCFIYKAGRKPFSVMGSKASVGTPELKLELMPN